MNVYLKPVITVPSTLEITAISKSMPMVVTVSINNPTTEANIYIPGMQVKLNVPQTYKMYQANNLLGTIQTVSGNEFTLDIDSSQFDAFVVPSGNVEQPATITPYGSRNYIYNNDSSPVAYQSYNNIGN